MKNGISNKVADIASILGIIDFSLVDNFGQTTPGPDPLWPYTQWRERASDVFKKGFPYLPIPFCITMHEQNSTIKDIIDKCICGISE